MSSRARSLSVAPFSLAPSIPSHRHVGHAVQFYEEDRVLLDEVSLFVATALLAGDAAIVIASTPHRAGIARRLKARGVNLTEASESGRYVSLDAARTLSKITVGDLPDWTLFSNLVGAQIEGARAAAISEQPAVAVFGEMVALQWAAHQAEAAVCLEKFWNELAKSHSFSLRCAYPIGSFDREEHGDSFLKICSEHSFVMPGESYSGLGNHEERLRNIAYLQQRAQALEAETALRVSEKQFRMLVEAVQDYAIFLLDIDGRVSSWNFGAERVKGYKAAEIIGKHFSCFYPEDTRFSKPKRELEIAISTGRVEDEGWRLRKDGSKFWANVVITALRDETGKLVGFCKITRDFTERMLAQQVLAESQKKLQASEKSLRRLSLHLLQTQDEERRRIGRELHDSLGQSLSVLKMKLDSLISLSGRTKIDQMLQDLEQCAGIAEESLKEVRTISYLLYPPMLEEMGLKSAIPWYLDGFTKRSGVKTTFDIPASFPRLPRDVELAIFRALQESLTNVHRHAESPTADVRIFMEDSTVVMQICDRGKGMALGAMDESGQDSPATLGVGLRGMHERMGQVGGRLELTSSPAGTTVAARIPIHPSFWASAATA
jgi:PAS domain S-box-containing protein